jgi:transglutaminase-like putative cysteine protease
VQAIVDFVHSHVTFGYQHAHHMKSAHDVYAQGTGVCRDFAHLALTFCRCMNIPARYCTGYLGDIGVPRDPAPMDFSGWFQAYLSGQWHTFDAPPQRPQGRPHPDGHRPRCRDVAPDHELWADGSGEVFSSSATRSCRRSRLSPPSLRGAKRRSNPCLCPPRYGLLRCARNDIEIP